MDPTATWHFIVEGLQQLARNPHDSYTRSECLIHIFQHRKTGMAIAMASSPVTAIGKEHPMAQFNKIILIGNLTRDPELRYTPNGTAVTRMGLAVNTTFGQGDDRKDTVCFIDVTVFGRQA